MRQFSALVRVSGVCYYNGTTARVRSQTADELYRREAHPGRFGDAAHNIRFEKP